MLERITINNIALITKCDLTLQSGLNILTGETGAGKSIVIDSLNFALGARADKGLIRYGENFATVEATFCNLNSNVKKAMQNIGLDDDDDILIVNRKMQIDGKNDIRINGKSATLSMLKELSATLVDIVGQHENQFLLKPQYHIELVDNYGGDDITKEIETLAKIHKEYYRLLKELAVFGDEAERNRKIELLSFQIDEIKEAALVDGELEEITITRKKIMNTERIAGALSIASDVLSEGHNNAVSMAHEALRSLNSISQFDESLNDIIDRLDSARIELKDIGDTISEIKDSYEFNENSLNMLETRLNAIKSIYKKYGGNYASAVEFATNAKMEYDMLINADEKVENLRLDIEYTEKELLKAANKVSSSRKKYAKQLEEKIAFELSDLGMKGTLFSIHFTPIVTLNCRDIRSDGYDIVEFLISPNPGAPLLPLVKIASGGEMSRIMLAIKVIISDLDKIDTIIFDEIDTGISGNAATTVACKMAKISRERQVVSITHLPQICSMADCHLEIKKSTVEGTTKTTVIPLSHDESLTEIARLVGGHTYSDSANTHAESMKKWSDNYKSELNNQK